MSRRSEILERHRDAITTTARRHKVSSIALAGSVARGTDHDDSDCDFVCTFAPGTTLIDVVALKRELSELLDCEVDVSSERALEPPYTSMLQDAISL